MCNKILDNRFIKFLDFALKSAKRSLTLYSSKFSRHDYTQRQLFCLLAFKMYMKADYRKVICFLEICPLICKVLKLRKIPHFTTLEKFLKRMNNPLLDSILKRTVDAFDIDRPKIAIDATGHSCDYSSTHYEKRTGKERKNFTKNTIVIDTDNQVILSFMVHKGPRHDMKDAIPALRKMMDFHPSLLTADKGYDAEAVHEFTINVMHAECMIPQRIGMAKTGKHRKRMLFGFDEIVYHQRSRSKQSFQ